MRMADFQYTSSLFLAIFLQLRWLIRMLYLNSSCTPFSQSHTGWMHMHKKKFFLVPINMIPLMFVLVYVHQDILKSSSIVMYKKYNS